MQQRTLPSAQQAQVQAQERFTYASEPHAVPIKRNKSKYREDSKSPVDGGPSGGLDGGGSRDGGGFNMMNDPRVVRGNTYAATPPANRASINTPIFEPNLPQPPSNSSTPAAHSSSNQPRKSSKKLSNYSNSKSIPGKHRHSQRIILEELTDRPIDIDLPGGGDQDATNSSNSNALQSSTSAIFVPSKIGKDTSTQIESGDLFDFDIEVEPLLEVLVGRTIHISIIELIQEEENSKLKKSQQEYEIIRNIELTELQRLQNDQKRKNLERERRKIQEMKRIKAREELNQIIVARDLSRNYLTSLHEMVLNELTQEGGGGAGGAGGVGGGGVYDPIRREIEEQNIGEILFGMKERVVQYDLARELLEGLIIDAWERANELQERGSQAREVKRERERKEAEALAKQRAAEEEAKRKAAEEAARRAAEEEEGGGGGGSGGGGEEDS